MTAFSRGVEVVSLFLRGEVAFSLDFPSCNRFSRDVFFAASFCA